MTTGTWPELDYASWSDTQKTLQLYTQIAGKVRLQLSPPRPTWLHARLLPTSRGFTTGPMPVGDDAVEMYVDIVGDRILVTSSTGAETVIPLEPAVCVADVYAAVTSAFAQLGVGLDLWAKPQEIADTTPLDTDTTHCTYDPAAAKNWFAIVTAVRNVFDEWSADFFGKSDIQFWWGAMDLAVLRFSGKPATPRPGVGYIMKWDLDAEMLNAGFWPGNDESPTPIFYGYLYPEPPGCEHAEVPHGAWVAQMGEWILPYADVQSAPDPAKKLREFLDGVYAFACQSGWDLSAYTYTQPEPSKREG